MRVTLEHLIQILPTKPTFAEIVTATKPKLLVKSRLTGVANPYKGGVTHTSRKNVLLNARYGNMVENQRIREAEPNEAGEVLVEPFIPEKLWGGNGYHPEGKPACLVACKGKEGYYLAHYPQSDANGKPKASEDQWIDAETGEVIDIDNSSLREYLSPSEQPKSQGTDKQISWRTPKLENVMQLKVNGQLYQVTDHFPLNKKEG